MELKGKPLKECIRIQTLIKNSIDIVMYLEDINRLRKDAMSLHSFFTRLCNDVEIDPTTNKAFAIGSNYSIRVPNPEPNCIKRIKDICNKYKLHYFIQRDPRGGTLYLWDGIISDGGPKEKGRFYSYCIFIA